MKKFVCTAFLTILLTTFTFCFTAQESWAKSFETLHADMLQAMIAKHKGKVIMLNFFATWCPPCQEEVPEIIASSKKYKGKKVAFIGLSVDNENASDIVTKFIEKHKITYPVYMAGKDLIAKYKIGSIPHNVFYDPKGKMIISQPGRCDAEDIQLVVDDLLSSK